MFLILLDWLQKTTLYINLRIKSELPLYQLLALHFDLFRNNLVLSIILVNRVLELVWSFGAQNLPAYTFFKKCQCHVMIRVLIIYLSHALELNFICDKGFHLMKCFEVHLLVFIKLRIFVKDSRFFQILIALLELFILQIGLNHLAFLLL